MEVAETDRRVAEELALEVRTASGGPRTWRRVASLLEAFGVERLSDEVRERIAAALTDVRIEVYPSLDRVERQQMVQLALPDALRTDASQSDEAPSQRPAITGTEWRSHATFSAMDVDGPRSKDATAWFDVNPALAGPDDALNTLWPFCRSELTREMTEDLLDAGGRPGVRTYGSDGRVRLVSVFATATRDRDDRNTDGSGSKAGDLDLRPVKLLAGSDWLISCWHEDDRAVVVEVVATAKRRLEDIGQPPTPGDLGINVVYSLACTYPATERRLHAWLDAWEADFHQRLEGTAESGLANLEKSTLIDLRRLLARLRSHLQAFEQPGVEPSEAWFTRVQDGETPQRVRQVVTATLADLATLDEALRTSLDLLVSTSAAEQLQAARAQAKQGERLSRQLALVTSALLVPTFLAELFGTKPYPGKADDLVFGLLLVAMVVLGLITYWRMTRRTQ